MASPLITKIGLVSAGVATLTGLGTVAYLTTRISIGDKLKKEGFNLISNDEDYKFVLFNNKVSEDLRTEISETTITHDNVSQIKKIKELCEKKTKEWFSNKGDKSFVNSKEWCTVPRIKTLRDKLGSSNLHKKDTWNAKFTEIAKQVKHEEKFLKALNLGMDRGQALTKESQQAGGKFETWCNSALDLKIYDTHEYKTEDNIKAWCLVA